MSEERKAMLTPSGVPTVCRKQIYYNGDSDCDHLNCNGCWNEVMEE